MAAGAATVALSHVPPPSTAVPGIDASRAASPSVFGRRISATMAPPPTANDTIMLPNHRRCKAAPGRDAYSAFAGLCTPILFFAATWV